MPINYDVEYPRLLQRAFDMKNEIEQLQARVELLEGALREIANAANYTAPEDIEARLHNEVKVYAIARAALKGGDDE